MNLNERKIKILEAIINDYIQTGEPIGSRTIAKKYDFGISSATIRNEMSDLEELGFIIQPHTSSGRVPSDKGYRLYVDRIMNYKALSNEEIQLLSNIVTKNISQINLLMEQTAKAIALLTNYTTIVSHPKITKDKIKYIQLIPLDNTSIIIVLVTECKFVSNYTIHNEFNLNNDDLNRLTSILNNIVSDNYNNLSKNSFNIDLDKYNLYDFEKSFIINIFTIIFKALEDKSEVFTSGVNNILEFPEFRDFKKAKNIFQTFEEKDSLLSIFENTPNKTNSSIQILIGDENNIEPLKNCSIIKAEYEIDGAIGNIGIIGPTRMDYAQTVSILNEIINNLNKFVNTFNNNS